MKKSDKKVIYRNKRETGNFATIDKEYIRNTQLSAKGKSILTYMLSRPDDWQFYASEIVVHFKEGQSFVDSGLKELESLGYVSRTKRRVEGQKFAGYSYQVYERPKLNPNYIPDI